MIFVILVIFIFLLDQYTKKYAEKNLETEQVKPILKGCVNLTLYKNKGVIFGHLGNKPKVVKRINIIGLIVTLIIYFKFISSNHINLIQKIGISSILGGALGNVYDRLKKKKVTDFFSFKIKPNIIFNLADLFIFIGGLLIVIGEITKKSKI